LKNTIYVLAGPTACGKSAFSIHLAKKINGIVVNADSMQVYKNLKILTARPKESEKKNISHYLYGYIDANERYNVDKWCNAATSVILEAFQNNLTPILVGGTGLYIQTLIKGLIEIPKIPENIKVESEKIVTEFGISFLINQIKNFDPESLKEVNHNDKVRLRRIWEVFESTGIKFSEWKLNNNKKFLENYNFKIFLILPDRKKNYEIVNSRFIKMINGGAIEEVKKLLQLNLSDTLPIMRAHGVPEIKKYLNNEISLDECINRGQQATRNYVKRQHTWWNSSNLEIFHKFNTFPIEIDINSIKFDGF
tara:strand:+ start:1516 stop:2439 length:924 start_codon:yes stop_codon:yes gene_type:complete